MLLNFRVENCYSFKDEQDLSMEASKVTRLPEHVLKVGRKRVLMNSINFGANASGKSNLIKAIDFSHKTVLLGTDNIDFDKKYFRLDNECIKRPGKFNYRLLINKKVYDYCFSISYMTQTILNEKLSVNDSIVFERNTKDETIINCDYDFKDSNERNRFTIYKEDFELKQSSNYKSFLTEIAERATFKSRFFEYFKDVYGWFDRIQVIYPTSRFSQLSALTSLKSSHDAFEKLLLSFDTGIESMENEDIELDEVFKHFPSDLSEKLKADISKQLLESERESITLRLRNNIYNISKDENRNVKANVVKLNHGYQGDLFDYADESDGTRRLFDLIPLLLTCEEDSLVLIDEVDRSLHPLLTRKFLKFLNLILQKNNSQSIITTHDSSLFDLDMFRIDEINLINRDENQCSIIKKLNSTSIRFDKKINRDYLNDAYGGVPTIREDIILEKLNTSEKSKN